jgi:hypothetical protein
VLLQGDWRVAGTTSKNGVLYFRSYGGHIMSMTYADAKPDIASMDATDRATDGVFVPRYAQRRHKSNKPVKTWMIIAPIGALAVIGTAAALMMGGGEQAAPAAPVESVSTLAPATQTAPTALAPVETPLAEPAPAEANPAAEPTPRRAEPAPRRAAPAVERPAARVETPAEPTGPQPYSAASTPALNTTSAQPAPASVQIQSTPTVSVQPVN